MPGSFVSSRSGTSDCDGCRFGCESLVDRVERGDREARDSIVLNHHPRILQIARTFLRRKIIRGACYEDCAQDTIDTMFRKLKLWHRRTPFCRWVDVLVRNRARNYLRSDRASLDRLIIGPVPEETLVSNEPPAGDASETRELMKKFTPEERRLIDMKLSGFSFTEIARRLKRSKASISRYFQSIKDKLQP